MANQWFKFYGTEYLSDPKISRLTAQERSCWLTLLCLASSSTEPGIIEYLTPEVLLKKSGIEWDPYDSTEWDSHLTILKTLENLKMIRVQIAQDPVQKECKIAIINWCKRQDANLTNAERQAKYRLNKKLVTPVTTKVTLEENRIEENRIDNSCANCFARFWSEYPLKKNRKKAEDKFKRLSHKVHELIFNDLPTRKTTEDWKKENGRFIPHPTTYLNGNRWEDEIRINCSSSTVKNFKSENLDKYKNYGKI